MADPDVRAAATLIVVGDRRVLERGAGQWRRPWTSTSRAPDGDTTPGGGPVLIDLGHLDPDDIERGVATAEGGRFALENFNTCLKLAADGPSRGRSASRRSTSTRCAWPIRPTTTRSATRPSLGFEVPAASSTSRRALERPRHLARAACRRSRPDHHGSGSSSEHRADRRVAARAGFDSRASPSRRSTRTR